MTGVTLRAYDPSRDARGLRACFVELQDWERAHGRDAPAGDVVADAYLASIIERCGRYAGVILVAEVDGEVAGFVSVWARVPPQEADESPTPSAWVSDIVVRERHRGTGIGRALLRRAEEHARTHGATKLHLAVLAANPAREWYYAAGFRDRYILVTKSLAGTA